MPAVAGLPPSPGRKGSLTGLVPGRARLLGWHLAMVGMAVCRPRGRSLRLGCHGQLEQHRLRDDGQDREPDQWRSVSSQAAPVPSPRHRGASPSLVRPTGTSEGRCSRNRVRAKKWPRLAPRPIWEETPQVGCHRGTHEHLLIVATQVPGCNLNFALESNFLQLIHRKFTSNSSKMLRILTMAAARGSPRDRSSAASRCPRWRARQDGRYRRLHQQMRPSRCATVAGHGVLVGLHPEGQRHEEEPATRRPRR